MSIMETPYVQLQLMLIKIKLIKPNPGGRWREIHKKDFMTEISKFNDKYGEEDGS